MSFVMDATVVSVVYSHMLHACVWPHQLGGACYNVLQCALASTVCVLHPSYAVLTVRAVNNTVEAMRTY
jgi:hypothetical protein